ncbi:PD-(D/E)XK nuclease family protein [Natronomonas salina]|uniref:PD-(D/E)XK nuclease family protein n=1 Tax=Natronomonas salina TaxID=1710540 RepID=UPI0015B77730|nr:PD-(D/E)XK nuclease family protein [Natronomonas salina]QLD89115.1 PD-(D/E)XK nuclease family protein [Natronomonas salina]
MESHAESIAQIAKAFENIRQEINSGSDWTDLADRYRHTLESDTDLTEWFPSVEAVVLGGFSLFSPLERQLVEAITDAWPTVALLPQVTDTDEAVGVDRGADRGLRAYRELAFEREYVPPGDAERGRTATPRRMYRHRGATESSDDPENVDLVQPETVPQELRYVACDIRSRIADGTDPGDLGIVLVDGGAYHERLVETLAKYDVPATLAIERPFGATALGEVLSELLSLGQSDPTVDSVTSLLSNPLVTIGQDDDAIDHREITRVARRLTSRRLETAYDHLDADTAQAIQEIVDDAKSLRATSLADLPLAVDELLDRLGVVDSIESLPQSPHGRTETDAANKLDRVLETLALTDGVADTDRGDAVERLDRALSGVSLDAETGREDDTVLVCDLDDAAPREFEHAYVLGLTEGHAPSNPERPFYFQPINEAHEDFEQADLQQRARYHFGVLLASEASLTLSVPERSLEGDPYVEADVITELRHVTDLDPESVASEETPPGCCEDVQRSLGSVFAHDGTDEYAPLVDQARETGAFDDAQHRRCQDGVACGAARACDELTPHDGQLSPETVASLHGPAVREPYSPSQLETYATCGFKYYMGTVLDIEEPDDIGLEPDARDRGGYVHDVLEHYYADLQSAPGEPVEIVADRETREAHLLDVALERLEERFDEEATAFQYEWLLGVLAGLSDPDSNPYYGTGNYDGAERGLLVRFLDHEFEEVAKATARPAWFEARVGKSEYGPALREKPVVVDTPAGPVPIHGMIDRVDVVPGTDPTQLVVRDYKTGGTPSETDTLGGFSYQLPIYAHLIEDVLDDVEVVGGAYYQVSPPRDVNHRKGLVASQEHAAWQGSDGVDTPFTRFSKPTFETHRAYRQFVESVLPGRLGELADGMTAGHYHPTVLDPDDAGCRYCGYSDTCDVRPHRRRDVIDEIDDRGVAAYVPLAARDADSSDSLEVQ